MAWKIYQLAHGKQLKSGVAHHPVQVQIIYRVFYGYQIMPSPNAQIAKPNFG